MEQRIAELRDQVQQLKKALEGQTRITALTYTSDVNPLRAARPERAVAITPEMEKLAVLLSIERAENRRLSAVVTKLAGKKKATFYL